MLKKTAQVLSLMTFLAVAACVTVNIYFPAAQVEKAAENIVDDVYGTDAQQPAKTNNRQLFSGPFSSVYDTCRSKCSECHRVRH